MARKKKYTPEQVEAEIARLNASADVKLAQKEQYLRNKREYYMRKLQWMERRGQELRKCGVTTENMAEKMFSGEPMPVDDPIEEEVTT